jgi:hypothetical protein
MDYFERSMNIRREILGREDILDAAGNAFRDREDSCFNAGGSVNLYRVGKLESGFHVALRLYRYDMDEGQFPWKKQARNMEQYCHNAEFVEARGDNVPSFCVGATDGTLVGIFTEDISNGGDLEVKHHPDQDFALVGLDDRKVFIDMDYQFRFTPGIEKKYFTFSNIIRA